MTARPNRLITRHELRQMVPYTPQHILRLEKERVAYASHPVGAYADNRLNAR